MPCKGTKLKSGNRHHTVPTSVIIRLLKSGNLTFFVIILPKVFNAPSMCTLTFFPKPDNGFVITSNRDESPDRNTLLPDFHEHHAERLLFPMDELAGGTWIGVSSKKRLVSLMNGGFTAHERKAEYRMSRGIIVKDLLAANDLKETMAAYYLADVEPFTIVAVDYSSSLRLYEWVWDGEEKHFVEKPLAPAIWSSSLLYSEEMKAKRELWFSEFLFDHLDPGTPEIMQFHREAGDGDPNTDLIMDRTFVKTKSITQVTLKQKVEMFYEDLQTGESARRYL